MKNAILIHGCCDKAEFLNDASPSCAMSHWFPWLKKQLIEKEIQTQTPEMPEPYKPKYEDWKRVFDQFTVDEDTTLVGHSCGAGFLLRWLGETKTKIDKLILVAPWLDPIKKRKGFLDFEIDPSVQSLIREVHVLSSKDDSEEGVTESIEIITNIFPEAQAHVFENKGHFTLGEMGTEEFPELLKLIV